MDNQENYANFIFYQSENGNTNIQVIADDENETIWASQNAIADIFYTSKQNISYHLNNIFKENELNENSVVKEILTTAADGKKYNTKFYNLDAIISVGYRVNSVQATTFRKWATAVLKEYMIKGFALDDDRLKQGNSLFGKDYFAELLERIREIRSSEKYFYQKINDLYKTSIDYDVNSKVTKDFYATVQNKLHWAIHHHTAAEVIKQRADYKSENMGLTTWVNNKKGGDIQKKDIYVAKNYLNEAELSELNRVVSMYLDFAENMARRQKRMRMVDWSEKLDSFLQFNEYDILKNAGRVSAVVAKATAEKEFEKYKAIKTIDHDSDFEKVTEEIKSTGKIPSISHFSISGFLKQAEEEEKLSDFDQKLKKGLGFNPKDE